MPEGKSISFAAGEYPELDGLPDGSKVKLNIMGTVSNSAEEGAEGQGGGTITFDNVEIETEGMADRELSSMTKQQGTSGMSQPAMRKTEDM